VISGPHGTGLTGRKSLLILWRKELTVVLSGKIKWIVVPLMLHVIAKT
jgi:hypothetical protein